MYLLLPRTHRNGGRQNQIPSTLYVYVHQRRVSQHKIKYIYWQNICLRARIFKWLDSKSTRRVGRIVLYLVNIIYTTSVHVQQTYEQTVFFLVSCSVPYFSLASLAQWVSGISTSYIQHLAVNISYTPRRNSLPRRKNHLYTTATVDDARVYNQN